LEALAPTDESQKKASLAHEVLGLLGVVTMYDVSDHPTAGFPRLSET
jgi:hypothetical protein